MFLSTLGRDGWFTVGRKGDERKIHGYGNALVYLASLPTAYWRRPNEKGNWGIVAVVRWVMI